MPLVYTKDLPVYTLSFYIDFICGLFACVLLCIETTRLGLRLMQAQLTVNLCSEFHIFVFEIMNKACFVVL